MTVLLDLWALLMGLSFGSGPIVGKVAQGFSKVSQLLGREAPKMVHTTYYLTLQWIREWPLFWPDPAPGSREASYVLRHFLLMLLELIFYESFDYCIHADWLVYLADVEQLGRYHWGGTSYAYLLCELYEVVCQNNRSYIGLYPLLTVSFCPNLDIYLSV